MSVISKEISDFSENKASTLNLFSSAVEHCYLSSSVRAVFHEQNLRLDTRMHQHVSKKIRRGTFQLRGVLNNTYGRALHLKPKLCHQLQTRLFYHFESCLFAFFELKVLETIYIRTRQPSLCNQKCVY